MGYLRDDDGNPTDGWVSGSETSEGAAKDLKDSHADLRERVRLYTDRRGTYGAICWDASKDLGVEDRATISARYSELKHSGDVVDSGRIRMSPKNRPCTVWVTPRFADPVPAPAPEGPVVAEWGEPLPPVQYPRHHCVGGKEEIEECPVSYVKCVKCGRYTMRHKDDGDCVNCWNMLVNQRVINRKKPWAQGLLGKWE